MDRRYFRDDNRNPQGILISNASRSGWQVGYSFRNPVDQFSKRDGDSIAFERYQNNDPIPYGLPREDFFAALTKRDGVSVPERFADTLYAAYRNAHYVRSLPKEYRRDSALPAYFDSIRTLVTKPKKNVRKKTRKVSV